MKNTKIIVCATCDELAGEDRWCEGCAAFICEGCDQFVVPATEYEPFDHTQPIQEV